MKPAASTLRFFIYYGLASIIMMLVGFIVATLVCANSYIGASINICLMIFGSVAIVPLHTNNEGIHFLLFKFIYNIPVFALCFYSAVIVMIVIILSAYDLSTSAFYYICMTPLLLNIVIYTITYTIIAIMCDRDAKVHQGATIVETDAIVEDEFEASTSIFGEFDDPEIH